MSFIHSNIEEQLGAHEIIYEDSKKYDFHITDDKLTRFLRDRRLQKGLNYLKGKFTDEDFSNWKILVVCGGVGGEGIFFLNAGFKDVTSSDFSINAIKIAKTLNSKLKVMVLNAEQIPLEDNSYDIVVVQDGLHHLPRPSLGFTEMLRVAKRAIIVVEPYKGLVGKYIGTEWEEVGASINYVYRWNADMVKQTVKSFLLKYYTSIKVFRLWDHSLAILKILKYLPKSLKLFTAKLLYKGLSVFSFAGNMMVCIVCK